MKISDLVNIKSEINRIKTMLTVMLMMGVATFWIFIYWTSYMKTWGERKGPIGWPIVGNLFQIRSDPLGVLTDWWYKYGDVYSVKLGMNKVTIINGYDAVKRASLDRNLASRPPLAIYSEYLSGDSMSFDAYGDRLIQMRRHSLTLLKRRKSMVGEAAADHLDQLIENWSRLEVVDPADGITTTVANVLFAVFFNRCKNSDVKQHLLNILLSPNVSTELFALGNQTASFPFLPRRKQKNGAVRSRMSKLVDAVFDCALEYGMTEFLFELNRIGMLTNVAEFLSAGVETSTATILWLLLFIAERKDIQATVYKEISRVSSNNNCPLENAYDKRGEMPVTEACIIEVLRKVFALTFNKRLMISLAILLKVKTKIILSVMQDLILITSSLDLVSFKKFFY